MIKIFIDPLSIEKNPNAGRSVYHEQGPITIRFSFHTNGCIPEHLLNKCIIGSWQNSILPENGSRQEGYIIDPNDVDIFRLIPGISLHIDRNIHEIHSMFPEPDYFFQHYDTPIICSNPECNHFVMSESIDDITEYRDECDAYTICPKCNQCDTYHATYESIKEAIKRLHL